MEAKIEGDKYLLPATKEKLVGINAVCYRATNERHQVKNDWRLSRVLEQKLSKDIKYNNQHNAREKAREEDDACRVARQQSGQWLGDVCEESHGEQTQPQSSVETVERLKAPPSKEHTFAAGCFRRSAKNALGLGNLFCRSCHAQKTIQFTP